MSFPHFALFGAFLAFSQAACAHSLAGLKRGSDLSTVSVAEIAREIPKGSILVLGENHGLKVHRDQHLEILKGLRAAGHQVSVGLEFFPAPFQTDVDQWRAGTLPEATFLQRIAWGQPSFDFYRDQAAFPLLQENGRTLALNAPRGLTSRVAKVGLDGLTAEERAQLPPNFSLGRDSYRERFLSMMPHLPDGAGDRYFAAQSIWDDTMAWVATNFIAQNPEQTLVIVVGEFHSQYGGGLPDRLRARGSAPVLTLSQVNLSGLSEAEGLIEIQPSAVNGPRADWVWAAEANPTSSPR